MRKNEKIFMLIRWSLHVYLTLNTSLSPTWASYTIKFSTLLSQDGWFVFIPKLCAQETLFTRLAILAPAYSVAIDGITTMSRGISGGKQTRTIHWEIDMLTSWAHFFLWALRVSGRFLMFTATKASERAGVLGKTTRITGLWESLIERE